LKTIKSYSILLILKVTILMVFTTNMPTIIAIMMMKSRTNWETGPKNGRTHTKKAWIGFNVAQPIQKPSMAT